MKKILFILSLILMSAGMWSDDITYTFNTLSWGTTTTNWTNGKSGNSYQSGQGIQVTTGKTGANGTSPISFSNISSVVVTYCTNNKDGVGNIKVQIGNGTEKSFSVTKPSSGGTSLKTATFNFSPNETGKVKITVNCTSNSIYIYSCTITYGSSITHTVKFLNCDTIYGQRTEIAEGTKISGFPTDVEICENCEKNGWKFFGWTKNGTDTLQCLTVNKNDTLYALYRISDIGVGYVTDTLTYEKIGITGTTYTDFTNISCYSNALYAGHSAGGYTSIQLRAKDGKSHSGIISTTSGGLLDSIGLVWNSNTIADRWLKVYTSNTPYTSIEDLYQSERTDSIRNGIGGMKLDYKRYIGIRSKQGALYLDTVFIRWVLGEVPIYSLCPKCYDAGVSVAHWDENSVKFDIDDFGDSVQVILSNTKDTLYKKTREDDYSIKFDKTGLKNLKCTDLKLTTFKTNDTTCIRHYLIPIMISDNTNVLCDSCNIAILPGGQLNITKDTVGIDVVVYEEGRLKVNSGKTFKINSLVLRKENNKVPYLINNGTITLASDSNYFFEIRTDADDWRWTTLPASHKVSNIRNHIGNPIKFREEVFVKHYNGEERAKSRGNGWQHVSADTIFTSGQGFLFGIDVEGNRKNVYRFKFPNSAVQLETEAKTINGLRAWGCNNKDLAPNHKGWNLIGNPFADNDTTDIISPVKVGKLVLDSSATPWNGKWVYKAGSETKNLRYAVIPVLDRECTADEAAAGGYASELLDDYVLSPFSSFFVQIGGNEDDIQALVLNPIINTPINKIVAKYSLPEEELFLRIKVGDRKTGMFISNKFTDTYEPGDDLESHYPIYQNIGGYKLLYSAINDSIIENGVFVNTPEGHLILDPKVNKNSFEYIYVYYNNTWYNILYEELDVTDSFIIYAKRKQIATDLEIVPTEGIYKFTDGRNVYINRNNKIYNIIGALYR